MCRSEPFGEWRSGIAFIGPFTGISAPRIRHLTNSWKRVSFQRMNPCLRPSQSRPRARNRWSLRSLCAGLLSRVGEYLGLTWVRPSGILIPVNEHPSNDGPAVSERLCGCGLCGPQRTKSGRAQNHAHASLPPMVGSARVSLEAPASLLELT